LIQAGRINIWKRYYEGLFEWAKKEGIILPFIPEYATNNGHMFYLICQTENQRNQLIELLKENSIHSVFHYLSLHKSDYYTSQHAERELLMSDKYTDCLLRLPMYFELEQKQIQRIIDCIVTFKS